MFRNTLISLFIIGLVSGCSKDQVVMSRIEDPEGPVALSKPALERDITRAVVNVRVWQGLNNPIAGVNVELSRSVSGRSPNYVWSGTTDENGQARIYIFGEDVSGYYQARVFNFTWASIPVNGGYEVSVGLPVGRKRRVTSPIPLISQSPVGTWVTVDTNLPQIVTKNLVDYLTSQGVPPSAVDTAVAQFTENLEVWSTVRFNEDGSVEIREEEGVWESAGTYTVVNNYITLVENGNMLKFAYFVGEDTLSFFISADQYLKADGDGPQEDLELLQAIFREGDIIQFHFIALDP